MSRPTKQTVFYSITESDFEKWMDKALERILPKIKKNSKSNTVEDEYLTVEETAELAKVSERTIHNYAAKGYIQKYGIGNRILFKKSEVLQSIVRLD